MMFKSLNGSVPSYLYGRNIVKRSQIHGVSSRQSNHITLSKYRTPFAQSSFSLLRCKTLFCIGPPDKRILHHHACHENLFRLHDVNNSFSLYCAIFNLVIFPFQLNSLQCRIKVYFLERFQYFNARNYRNYSSLF